MNDFDLGMDTVYDLFGNADENEAWKLIIEKNGTKSKEEQNYKSLYPNQYRPKEQTNSPPPATNL
ncbi:MAG: hypothetical protein IJW31_06250 [Lentisphaeria bacterium]|nr:hypothetical protein [Lentisphaeria bacterium]